MKKKICMLTLILTLSAAALAGCSNTEGTGEDNAIIEGESEGKETITRDTTDDEDNEDVETDDADTDEAEE